MVTEKYVESHGKEFLKLARYLGTDAELRLINDMLSELQAEKEAIEIRLKNHDRYEIKNIGGYYVLFKNGKRVKGHFISEKEAEESYLPDEDLT